MTLPVPAWLKQLPLEKQTYARRRLNLRLAALLATEDGRIGALAQKVNRKQRSLGVFMTLTEIKKMPPRLAADIERATDGAVTAADLLPPQD